MKKVLIAIICSIPFTTMAQMEIIDQPVSMLQDEISMLYNVNGALSNDASYTVGFNKKDDYNVGVLEQILVLAQKHIIGLADSLKDPNTQKKLRMIVSADGSTVTFNLKQRNIGSELVYIDGAYQALKSSYDTLEVLKLIEKAKGKDAEDRAVMYTIRLKDINDIEELLRSETLPAQSAKLDKKVRKESWLGTRVRSNVAMGGSLNSTLPFALYIDVSLFYVINSELTNSIKPFAGLFLSTSLAPVNGQLNQISSYGIEAGGLSLLDDGSVKKASLVLGLQSIFEEKLGKPVFMLGLNLPVSNKFAIGMQMASNFDLSENAKNDKRTSISLNFKYNL